MDPNLPNHALNPEPPPNLQPLVDRLGPPRQSLLSHLSLSSPQDQLIHPELGDRSLLSRLSSRRPLLSCMERLSQTPQVKKRGSRTRKHREPSLLMRMSARSLSGSLSPSSPSAETDKLPKWPLSAVLSRSSSVSPFPNPKRKKLSSSTPRSLTPSDTVGSPSFLPDQERNAMSTMQPADTTTHQWSTILLMDQREQIPTTPTDRGRGINLPLPTSLGSNPMVNLSSHCQPAASKPASALQPTTKTFQGANSRSGSPPRPLAGFLSPSGREFSVEKPLTLTTSSPLSTALQLMKRERLALETRRSALESLRRSGRLAQPLTGHQLGDSLPRWLFLPSHIAPRNSTPTVILSMVNSKPNSSTHTPVSSCSTLPFATSSREANLASSPTTKPSRSFIRPSSCQTVPNPH